MRKFLSIAVASLLIAASFASCGSSETENTSSASSQVSDSAEKKKSAEEETSTEEITAEEISENTDSQEEQTDAPEEDFETETSAADDIPEPETLPEIVPDEAAETDFIGKWECSKMATEYGDTEEYAGVSIAKMIQFEVLSDNTAEMTSFMLDPNDEKGSLTWEYSGNILILTNSEGNHDGSCAIQNGELIVFDEENSMQIYFTKVDDFTPMSQEEQDKIFAQMESEGFEVTDDTDSDEISETDTTDSAE